MSEMEEDMQWQQMEPWLERQEASQVIRIMG